MPVPVPPALPDCQIKLARVAWKADAETLEAQIYEAVDALTASGALPRDGWRFLAHIFYCRAIYTQHIAPLEERMTFDQIANHLNELGVPRFRGSTAWSAASITDIRQTISSPHNKIELPDP